MTRKFTFLLMALLTLTSFKSWGQTEIAIGNGMECCYNSPFNSVYNYSYNEILYGAEEIGMAGIITAISFNTTLITTSMTYSLDIYMKNVSRTSFASETDWETVSSDDLVCQTSMSGSQTGWVTFTLDTPFEYDGEGSLMIAVDNNTGDYVQPQKFFFYHTATGMDHCKYSDDGDINPANPSATSGYTKSCGYRPDIKISMIPSGTPHTITYVQPANGTISGPEVGYVNFPIYLTATPDYGYEFGTWNVTNASTSAAITVTDNQFIMPDADVNVTATFNARPRYTVTVDGGITHGTVTATPNSSILGGETVSLTITPDAGYGLATLTVTDGNDSPVVVSSNQFSMPESNVNVSATFVPMLTVNDGTVVNEGYDSGLVPFNGYHAHNYNNKSQFIIPASDLALIIDAFITDITFYLDIPSTNMEYTLNQFDIYVKEVDYTAVGNTYPEDFANMTKVYSGKLTTSDYQLKIHFDEPYVYSGKNLMIGFNQTAFGTWGRTRWYGKEEGTEMRSISGYGSTVNSYNFLPKTSFSFERHCNIAVSQPEEGGIIATDPENEATAGTIINLAVTPAIGYTLDEWIVKDAENNKIPVTDNSFEMPASDVTVTATFNTATLYDITFTGIDETLITVAAKYNGEVITAAQEGIEVTLEYTLLDEGYSFYWTLDGEPLTGNTFTMPATDVEIDVNLSERPRYAVNIDGSITNGTITANPSTNVLSGTTVTLTITPADGYDLASLSVTDGNGNSVAMSDYTFQMPESDITITATFIPMLIVNDGTATNEYIPVYGYYCDASSQQNQFIIPAELLAEMNGGTISGIFFYLSSPAEGPWGCTWTVKLMETTETTISSLIDVTSATSVYTGVLNGQSNTMEVPFATSYVYNGGNLLVDFSYSGETGSYKSAYFYGVSAPDNSSYCQFIDYRDYICNKPQAFLPKTSFVYTPNPNLHHITVNQPAEGGTISAPTTAFLGDVVTLAVTPEIGYNLDEWIVKDAENNEIPVTDNSFEMPASDVTVTATFNTATLYDITFTGIDETLITVAAKYNGEVINAAQEGIEVTLEYTLLDEGYSFNYWTLNGELLTGNTFTMPATDVEIDVNLSERPRYAVNIDGSINNGTITANPSTNVLSGTTVTLTITPADGYGLASLSVTDGSGNSVAMLDYTFQMPESDITVTATFVKMLTVYDGTTTNQFAAVYTFYGDVENSAAQFVIPASQLEAMAGGTISSLEFYVDPTQTFWPDNLGGPVYAGYIMEVEETAMSSFIDFGAATNMFNGHVALTNGDSELVIDFAEPFTYNGGNLAIAFECTAKASFTRLHYYGTTVTGGSIYRDGATASVKANNFIPKTTFYYTPGEVPEYDVMEITANQDPNHKTHYYSTFYSSTNAYALPEGVTAYTGTADGDVLKLTSIADGIIPAGEAVILRLTTTDNTAMTQQIQLTATTTTATKSTDNMLQGSDVAMTLPQNSYALSLGQKGVGFYKFDNVELPAHKAYLTYASGSAISLRFSFGDSTDIDTIETEAPAKAYNLQGQQVDENYKGIVIVNGKKVLNN